MTNGRWRPWFRRQPPVYSPVTLRGVAHACAAPLAPGDPRQHLAAQLRQHYHADRVTLVGSGTQALQLALQRARVLAGADNIVALPAYSCVDVASAAVGAGARIALYDLDPDTLQADPVSLAGVVARGASVVVVAPLYGLPPEWEALEHLTQGSGAVLVEDAAQGFGGMWRDRPLGALGSLSVLSFGRGKGWTGGAGGALLERDTRITAGAQGDLLAASRLADVGVGVRALAQWVGGRPTVYALPAAIPWLQLGETRYREPVPPHALPRAAAALLAATWGAARAESVVRQHRARQLLMTLRLHSVNVFRGPPHGKEGWLRLPIRIPRGLAGLTDVGAARALGVSPGYPITLADVPAVRARLAWDGRWPGAASLVRDLITLPTHSRLTALELRRVLALLPR